MKIVILTGSPRKNGNSNTLVEAFIKGAEEKGHTVIRFDSAFKNIHPCIACNKCRVSGDCAFKDDFQSIKNDIVDCDMIVFATPMYYFGISAQLKTLIDRFHSINNNIKGNKKSALFLTYAEDLQVKAESIIKQYEFITEYLGWDDIAQIIASGVWDIGAINNTPFVKQAYELGKNL